MMDEINMMKKQMAEKDDVIKNLKVELADKNETVAELKMQIKEGSQKIARLEQGALPHLGLAALDMVCKQYVEPRVAEQKATIVELKKKLLDETIDREAYEGQVRQLLEICKKHKIEVYRHWSGYREVGERDSCDQM